jgi:hypothetical protein
MYTYAVDAFNGSGNSLPSSTITVTTDDPPPGGGGGIFADGFESGNLSAWDASSGLIVQTAVVGEGGSAARNTANVAFATKSFGTTYDELYARILLNVPTSGDTFRALKFQTSSGADIFGVFVVSDGRLRTRNYNTSTNTTSSASIHTGWNDIQARALIGGGTSQVQVWLDGVEIVDLASSASLGTQQIGGIEIGNQISSRVHDAVYDGVVADTEFISPGPPPPPPATPTGLQATSVTSNRVDLSWDASTGATGYTVYRDGSPIDTTTATTYSDTTVSPSTPYTYAVDAFNAGGNSAPTQAIMVTTEAGPPGGGTAVIKAAGDIACDPSEANWNNNNGTSSKCRHKFTAQLLTGADRILTLGDQQYSCGGTQAFNQSFHPTWGQFKSIIHPILADEEYDSAGLDCGAPGPDGYFNYFGAAAGPQPGGYYSFDFNGWRFIALNAECNDVPGGCAEGSPQNNFLENALVNSPQCTIAMLHEPRFRSKKTGSQIGSAMLPFWQDLHAAGVEMVLSGDSHFYERFLPQDPNGNFDPTGTVQWVVGTGGKSRGGLASASGRLPNSASATSQAFGVLELTLHQGFYEWDFLVEGSSSFSDSGSASCH